MTETNRSEHPAGTRRSGFGRERSRGGRGALSQQAETGEMELAATREQARRERDSAPGGRDAAEETP